MSNHLSRRHLNRFQQLTSALLCAAGLVLFAGCSQSADARADSAPTDQPDSSNGAVTTDAPHDRSISPRNRPGSDDDDGPQTRLIRTLDDALDEVDTGDEDVDKDDLRGILYEADRELRHVLGGKSKEAILRANQKPPIRYQHEPPKPAVIPEKDDADNDAPSTTPAP
jgi:hypothetical protein